MILADDYVGLVLFEFDFLLYVIMMLVNCEHVLFTYCQPSGILLLPVVQVAFKRDCFAAIGGV